MGDVVDSLKYAGNQFGGAIVDTVLQSNPITNTLTDYSGMGRSGGAGTWSQVYVHRTEKGNDIILGYGKFSNDEDRVKEFDDLEYDENSGIVGIKRGQFTPAGQGSFDKNYQMQGSLERRVPYSTGEGQKKKKEPYTLVDRSRVYRSSLRNEDAYSINKSKRTHLLKNGVYTGIDVVDIPVKEGVLGIVRPSNHELGRIGRGILQSLMTRYLTMPLMKIPMKMVARMQRRGIEGLDFDPYIELADSISRRITNGVLGIRTDFEYNN